MFVGQVRDRKKRRTNRSLLPNLSSTEYRGKQSLYQDCVDLATVLNQPQLPDGSGMESHLPDTNSNVGTSQVNKLSDDTWHLGLYFSRRDTYKVVEKESKFY